MGEKEPYFLEANFDKYRGTPRGVHSSRIYNETALLFSLQHTASSLRQPAPLFRPFTLAHFRAQLGSLSLLALCHQKGASVHPPSVALLTALKAKGLLGADVPLVLETQEQQRVLASFGVQGTEDYWPSRGFFAALFPAVSKVVGKGGVKKS